MFLPNTREYIYPLKHLKYMSTLWLFLDVFFHDIPGYETSCAILDVLILEQEPTQKTSKKNSFLLC